MQRKNGDKAQRAPGEWLARWGLRASINSDFLRNRSTLERTEKGDMGQPQSIDCGKLRAPREAGSIDPGKQPRRSL